MIIATLWEQDIAIHFSYLPAWEFFWSLHVLTKPEHHNGRKAFVERVSKEHEELVVQVRDLAELSNDWIFLVDADEWEEVRDLEIPQVLQALEQMTIYRFNQMIAYYHSPVDIRKRDQLLALVRRYYEEVFQEKEEALRPLLIRQLQEEWQYSKSAGFWSWCSRLHPRLQVQEDCLIYRKEHEYVYRKDGIRQICATVSTFLHPHLWRYERAGRLQMVRSVLAEPVDSALAAEPEIPSELVGLFQALGDQTRLQLVQLLLKKPSTTKELAATLGITEAAVSKQLKQLSEAKLVRKHRESRGVIYEFRKSEVDFIPYRFFEWM